MTRRLAAVMITDIVGFTTQAQRDEAAALRQLEEHRGIVRGALHQFEGREVKTLGDGFLVEFGSALSATECGIEILRRFEDRNRAKPADRIDLRIGIHLGEVVPEGTDILGDAVNVTSRIEPLAEPGGLTISGPVYDQVRGHLAFPARSLPAPSLKHVLVPIAVYRIELPWKAPPVPTVTPWIDREKEFAELLQAHEKARQRHGSVVILLGEPGTGKTRLVEEVLKAPQASAVQLLRGQALRGEGNVPYAVWSEAVRSFVRQAPPAVLARACGPQLAELARLVPEIVERTGSPPPQAPAEGELAEDRLMGGIVQFFQRLGEEAPVVLFLEDLHWADPYSLKLLRRAARAVSGHRWLVIAAARDQDPAGTAGLADLWVDLRREPGCTFLTLSRLAAPDFDRLLDALVPGLSPAFRQQLQERCDGNPWFAEELLRQEISAGALQRAADGWGLDPAAQLKIPETVQHLLRDRLERLDAATVQVLRAASVAGSRIPFDLLRQVSGTPEELLLLCVERALQARVLEERATPSGAIDLAFRDTLTRDVLYEGLSLVRARGYHRKIAEGLEQLPEADRREQASGLADHFLRGGVPAKALDYALIAAGRAAELFAHPEAERLYRSALELMEEVPTPDARRAETLGALAKELELLGRTSAAVERYQAAADLWERAGQRRRASSVHSWISMLLNDLPGRESEVLPHSERAVALLQAEGDSAELAQATYSLGTETLRWGTDLARAQELLRRSVELAIRFGDTRTEAWGTYFLALTLPVSRKVEATVLASRLAARLEHADDTTQPSLLYNVGANLFLGGNGDVGAARRYLGKAREIARRKGIRRHETAIALGLADLDRFSGAWDAAETVARRVLAEEPEENFLERVEASVLLARLTTARGRLEEAGRLLRDLEEPKYRALLATFEAKLPLALVRAEFEFESGRTEDAGRTLDPALEEGAKSEPTFSNALTWTNALYLGVALKAGGGTSTSPPNWLGTLGAVAERLGEPWSRAWHHRAEGLVAQAQGDPVRAVSGYEESLEEWERVNWPFETGKTLLLLGEAELAAGHGDRGQETLAKAEAVFAQLGADRYAGRTLAARRRH